MKHHSAVLFNYSLFFFFISLNSKIIVFFFDSTLCHLAWICLRLWSRSMLKESQNPWSSLSVEFLSKASITFWMMTLSSFSVKRPFIQRWLLIMSHFLFQKYNDNILDDKSPIRIIHYEQNLLDMTQVICSWYWICWSSWSHVCLPLNPLSWPF